MNWLFNIFSRGLLSGRWTGSYEQDGQTFPIETSIRHRGNKLQGTMLDLKRSHQQPLRKALEVAGLPFNEIQQFIQEVRSQFPDSIDGKIDYLSISGIWFIKPSNKSDTEASGTFQLTRENT